MTGLEFIARGGLEQMQHEIDFWRALALTLLFVLAGTLFLWRRARKRFPEALD